MKKYFFHKEVIVKRGNQAENFLVILRVKALVLNSMGNKVFSEIQENSHPNLLIIMKF